jgi:YegS/Rv2252/BmrU family lipid kinase
MRHLLILNPRAGKAKKIEKELVELFKKNNILLEVKETKKPLDARSIARHAVGRFSVVIAGGGDGTINETINGLANSKTKLGIIPLGTENAIAQGMNIPLDPFKAAEIIIKGSSKTLDLGIANGRYFILTAGVGIDAKALSIIKPAVKKILGRTVYPLSAVHTVITHFPQKLEVWLDDQVLPRWGYFIVIANIKHYGATLHLAQLAEPDDGYLDVCIFKKTNVINMFKYFISASSKGSIPITEFADIEYFKAKKLKIKADKKVLAHTDAEIIGTTPISIRIYPKAIRVIC